MALALCGWNQDASATAYSINCDTTTTQPIVPLNNGALAVVTHDLTASSNTSYTQIVSLAGKTGLAQGYNNSVSQAFTENKTGANPSGIQIKLSKFAKVDVAGTSYYQILFDIKGSDLCTFTDIRVYASPNTDPNVTTTANLGQLGASGTLAYSLGSGTNTLAVTALLNTSNQTQFALLVPVASFGIFGGANDVNNYAYVYVSGTGFGSTPDNVNLGADISQTTTPEARTVWGGVSMALILGVGYVRKRFSKTAPSVG